MMSRWSFCLAVLLSVVLAAGVAVACPMCKDSIPNSDAAAPAGVPNGFNLSVYYMLIGVFTVGGLVIGVIVRGVRATNAAHLRSNSAVPHRQPR